jgi:hypothetical protein
MTADAHAYVQRMVSVVKMATMLEVYYYRRAAFFCSFLWAEGLSAKDIHKEMFPVYSGSVCHVKRFTTELRNSQGRSKITDEGQSDHPVEIMTEATVWQVEKLIQADRIDSVATALGCSHGLAYSIMHGCLKFRKVCAW